MTEIFKKCAIKKSEICLELVIVATVLIMGLYSAFIIQSVPFTLLMIVIFILWYVKIDIREKECKV